MTRNVGSWLAICSQCSWVHCYRTTIQYFILLSACACRTTVDRAWQLNRNSLQLVIINTNYSSTISGMHVNVFISCIVLVPDQWNTVVPAVHLKSLYMCIWTYFNILVPFSTDWKLLHQKNIWHFIQRELFLSDMGRWASNVCVVIIQLHMHLRTHAHAHTHARTHTHSLKAMWTIQSMLISQTAN